MDNSKNLYETFVSDIGDLPDKRPDHAIEIINKRTPFSTRFVNPDGSFTEEIFNIPQFYNNAKEKTWKRIDNTLQAHEGVYENTENDIKVRFVNQAGTRDLLTIEKDGRSISINPVNANTVSGEVKNSEITYWQIFPDTHISYQLQGAAVKESIILTKFSNNNSITFELILKGLADVVEADGTIAFTDEKGNKIWHFRKPYMTDANGKFSDQVRLSLRKENEKAYLDVIAGKEFLEEASTKYPVTIDPTIDNWNIMVDTFVASLFPTSSYSNLALLYTGNDPAYYGTMRSLVQFFLPSLPSSSRITSATFNAYQTKSDAANSAIGLHRIISSWGSSATWNTQPTINATPESTITNNAANTYWQWDITQLVKDWYNGVQSNYGFMLKQQPETAPFRSFRSVSGGTNTPRLSINYVVDALGLENYWAYTKDGVNPSNGNLVLQYTDFSIPGRGVPVSVTRTYNSRSAASGIFGYGWRSNIETQLVDAGSGPITLIDDDGTRHIFGQSTNNTYVASGGVYLTLVKNADGTYTITQTDGVKFNFNPNGRISSIVDTNSNSTHFAYTSGKLSSITDASGRVTNIAYDANGYVSTITYAGNRTITYAYDTNGNLIKSTNAAGKFVTFGYDANHNLTSVTDERNTTTTLTYDTAADRVSSISRPITINGTVQTSTTTYTYDTMNSITTMVDGEGRRTDYTYNPNGNVVQTTENPLDTANRAITTFSYNNNNLTEVKDPNSNRSGSTSTYVYTYDPNGNITSVKLPENQTANYTYDNQNNVTQEQDFNDNTTTFAYNSDNDLIEAIDPYFQTTANRYSPNGNLSYSTLPMSTADNLLSNSSFEISSNGITPNEWAQSVEPGKTATFSWPNDSKFGKKSYAIANTTGWATIGSGLVSIVSGWNYIISAYFRAPDVIANNNAIIAIEYFNVTGTKLSEETYSFSVENAFDWTRIQAVLDAIPTGTARLKVNLGIDSATTGTIYFDGIQLEAGTVVSAYNLVENSSFERSSINSMPDYWTGSNTLTSSDRTDSTEKFVGSYSFKITGQSGVNKYIRQRINISGDGNNRFTLSGWSKQTGANVAGGYYALQVAINNTDGTTDWSNANDFSKTRSDWQHLAVEVNPAQNKTFSSIDIYCYYYNQTGAAWFDAIRLETGSTITAYGYDTAGNYVTSITDPYKNAVTTAFDAVGNATFITDAKNKTTSYLYDNRNLLTQVTDAKNNTTIYGYDNTGNRITVKDARNNTTTYQYNEFNLVSSITNPLNQVMQFGYDKNGNMTKLLFPKGDAITFAYNALNRLNGIYYNGVQKWSYIYDANGNIKSVTNAATGQSVTYTYDSNNRLTRQEEGTSNRLDFAYDANSNLTTITAAAGASIVVTGYAYDSLDQMVAISRNTGNLVKMVYDERGNVATIKRSNGIYTTFEYDALNRVISIKNYNTGGSPFDSQFYTYDANGNRASLQTSLGTVDYLYDASNQLIEETLLDGTKINYGYDAVGNRTLKTVELLSGGTSAIVYSYDNANQLIDVGGQPYTYDANGNLTSNGSKTFVYDERNQLQQIKDASGNIIASFTYDDKGRRNSMTASGVTTNFHYSGNKVVYETDASNTITAEYTWDTNGNPVTFTKNGATYYYHTNAHGDVLGLIDSSGTIVATYEYDAWGNIIGQLGTMASANPHRYAGYRYDEVTGLYYLMARYYDAAIGRFITRDPFHGISENPLTLNQYSYANGNPILYVDVSGNFAIGVNFAASAINVLLGLAVGGGVGAIQSFIINRGKREAMKIFTRTVTSKIIAWGAPHLAWIIGAAVAFAMDYFNLGSAIARFIDSRDTYPNNGWLG